MQTYRLKQTFSLSLAIMAGMLSQSLFTLVDTAMVGRLGDEALAAVSLSSYANFALISLVAGLSIAVQALVARRKGEYRLKECAEPVNACLLAALLLVLPLSLGLWFLAGPILSLLTDSNRILSLGTDYFQLRILGMAAIAMNLAYRGYWNGSQKASQFLLVLLCIQVFNLIANYLLIFGQLGLPALGIRGSALGTTLSMYLGSVLHFFILLKRGKKQGFIRRLPTRETWLSLYKLALPNSIQQLIFALGLLGLFWIIAQIGMAEVAVAHILTSISLLLILPGVGLGMALTTTVSHALGAKAVDRAYQAGRQTTFLAFILLVLFGLPLWIMPEALLGLFSKDPKLIHLGVWPLRIQGLGLCLDAASLVLAQALLGAGASRTVMLVNVSSQWLIYLPLAWLVGPLAGFGLTGIWVVQIVQRAMNSLIFLLIWRRKKWASIAI